MVSGFVWPEEHTSVLPAVSVTYPAFRGTSMICVRTSSILVPGFAKLKGTSEGFACLRTEKCELGRLLPVDQESPGELKGPPVPAYAVEIESPSATIVFS